MAGEKVFEQGDTSKSIYFVTKGSVNIMMLRPKVHTIIFEDDTLSSSPQDNLNRL